MEARKPGSVARRAPAELEQVSPGKWKTKEVEEPQPSVSSESAEEVAIMQDFAEPLKVDFKEFQTAHRGTDKEKAARLWHAVAEQATQRDEILDLLHYSSAYTAADSKVKKDLLKKVEGYAKNIDNVLHMLDYAELYNDPDTKKLLFEIGVKKWKTREQALKLLPYAKFGDPKIAKAFGEKLVKEVAKGTENVREDQEAALLLKEHLPESLVQERGRVIRPYEGSTYLPTWRKKLFKAIMYVAPRDRYNPRYSGWDTFKRYALSPVAWALDGLGVFDDGKHEYWTKPKEEKLAPNPLNQVRREIRDRINSKPIRDGMDAARIGNVSKAQDYAKNNVNEAFKMLAYLRGRNDKESRDLARDILQVDLKIENAQDAVSMLAYAEEFNSSKKAEALEESLSGYIQNTKDAFLVFQAIYSREKNGKISSERAKEILKPMWEDSRIYNVKNESEANQLFEYAKAYGDPKQVEKILRVKGFLGSKSANSIVTSSKEALEMLQGPGLSMEEMQTVWKEGAVRAQSVEDVISLLAFADQPRAERLADVETMQALIQRFSGRIENAREATFLLHYADLYGDQEMAKAAFKRGTQLNPTAEEAIYLLGFAKKYGDKEIRSALFRQGAESVKSDVEASSYLREYKSYGDPETILKVIQKGAENLQDKQAALLLFQHARQAGDKETAAKVLYAVKEGEAKTAAALWMKGEKKVENVDGAINLLKYIEDEDKQTEIIQAVAGKVKNLDQVMGLLRYAEREEALAAVTAGAKSIGINKDDVLAKWIGVMVPPEEKVPQVVSEELKGKSFKEIISVLQGERGPHSSIPEDLTEHPDYLNVVLAIGVSKVETLDDALELSYFGQFHPHL